MEVYVNNLMLVCSSLYCPDWVAFVLAGVFSCPLVVSMSPIPAALLDTTMELIHHQPQAHVALHSYAGVLLSLTSLPHQPQHVDSFRHKVNAVKTWWSQSIFKILYNVLDSPQPPCAVFYCEMSTWHIGFNAVRFSRQTMKQIYFKSETMINKIHACRNFRTIKGTSI